jgi:hypothetical protein
MFSIVARRVGLDRGTQGREQRKLIENSKLFDAEWYLERNPEARKGYASPVDHYLEVGWRRGRSPSALFDVTLYLSANPDVAAANMEPLLHFVRYGAREGRKINAAGTSLSDTLRRVGLSPDDGAPDGPPILPDATLVAVNEHSPDLSGATSIRALLDDPLIGLVAREARNSNVLYVGFRGRETLELAVACIVEGAKSFRILHREPLIEITERLRRVAKRLRVEREIDLYLEDFSANDAFESWQPHWTDTTDRGWVVSASLGERDIRNKVGGVDKVVDLLGLFHDPDIVNIARRLAFIARDGVIFSTIIVDPFDIEIEGEVVSFGSADIWYAGAMTAAQSKAMARYWRDRGVELPQYQRFPDGVTRLRCQETGFSGVWWWFMGAGGVDTVLELAGLERVTTHTLWDGRSMLVVARKLREARSLRVDGEPIDNDEVPISRESTSIMSPTRRSQS